jgi:flagellar FliL protein
MAVTEEAVGNGIARKKLSGKKLVLFIILPLLLLGGGGVAAWYLLFPHDDKAKIGASDQAAQDAAEDAAESDGAPPTFVEMDEMLVNLASSGPKPNYLKLKVSLELGGADDQKKLEEVMPRIIDQFQVYLRGVRVDDLQGSEGLQRLREELLMRARMAGKPVKIKDVLFQTVQVQ